MPEIFRYLLEINDGSNQLADSPSKNKSWLISRGPISDIWKKLEQQSLQCSYWLEQSSDWYKSETKLSKASLSLVFCKNNEPIGAIRYSQSHTPIGNYLTSLGGPIWIPGKENEVADQLGPKLI